MRTNIEFRAVDVTLRGWLFTPDEGKGPFPTVIATHGYGAVKEQSLSDLGEAFAKAGLAAIIYDHRNLGASDGEPRGHIDPWEQIRDYRHAISFAETLDVVDSDRIGVWGTSYSGAHAIVVTAIDKRVKAGCSQVPMISGYQMFQRVADANGWHPLLQMLDDDRRAWARGDTAQIIPLVAEDPEAYAALHSARSYLFYNFHNAAAWRNEITIRSLDLAMEYEPGPYLERLESTPYMFVVAEDDISTPTDHQFEAYGRIRGHKELKVIPGDHYTSYMEFFPEAASAAVEFFQRQLTRKMWKDPLKYGEK